MLRVRGFVQGEDEETWVTLLNQAFHDYEDRSPLTLDDITTLERNPRFDVAGMLIVESDGKPVGGVNARVDKKRMDKKGFVLDLGVIPGFREKGIGRELLKKAIESLTTRGMKFAEVVIEEGRVVCKRLVESMGFTLIRSGSMMTFNLGQIPSNIGENKEVAMRTLRRDSLEDIKLFNWLLNDAFKEHFNHRPDTLEETRFLIQNDPWLSVSEFYIAHRNNDPVGFIGVRVDTKYNKSRDKRRGWVNTIGVLKPHRQRGIGTTLLLYGLQWLQSQEMGEAALWVDDQNPTRAIELYKKIGFNIAKKGLTYLKKLA